MSNITSKTKMTKMYEIYVNSDTNDLKQWNLAARRTNVKAARAYVKDLLDKYPSSRMTECYVNVHDSAFRFKREHFKIMCRVEVVTTTITFSEVN